MELVWPSLGYLHSYVAALERGWSPDNVRGAAAANEQLERIAENPAQFVASLVDREASGPPVELPDGTTARRLPGFVLWMWDGEMCGVIGLRWQPGTGELPPTCLGHIGYSVVPWKRRLGYATVALRQLLPLARAERLPYVQITTDLDNVASRRIVEANGGVLVETFTKPPQFGSKQALRFRIAL